MNSLNSIFKSSTINDCQLLNLPIVYRDLGRITSIESQKKLPFALKRIYYLYDVPSGVERGGHAHKQLSQLIIAASGSFEVKIQDGTNSKIFRLDRPYIGLYLVPGIWRELINFSSGSICLVLASHKYDSLDYIRNIEDFVALKNHL
jgi:hypothetical protein